MKNSRLLVGLIVVVAASIGVRADTISLNAFSGSGWLAIAPPGAVPNNSYPSPSPIGSVGLAWESTNVGWNSSAGYNTAGWTPYAGGWIDPSGITPFYARDLFHINGTPTFGTFTLLVDDDSQVWVNGTLVPGLDDENMNTGGNANPTNTANITSYLTSGDNVIAFKAHNAAGGGFSVIDLSGYVTYTPNAVPEATSTVALLGLALSGLVALRRRSVRA